MKLILYKIKLFFLYLFNLIILRKGFRSSLSPTLIFLKQYQNGSLNRYDVIVRYLLIDYWFGNNDCGREIYHKMQKFRAGTNQKQESYYLHKEHSFKKIIDQITVKGIKEFKKNSCIRLNKKYELCDGSHRLAIGLYFQIPKICFTRSQARSVQYGIDQFDYLSEREKTLIKETEKSILSKIDRRTILNEILLSQRQQFGRGIFYQSFEELKIDGQRPTKTRFEIYGLESFLNKNMSVLDIGSNCGFFSLYIAKYVHSVVGIEYNSSLVEISNVTKTLIGNKNTSFIAADFNKINFSNKYDLILSFAVHYWIGKEINEYASQLTNLLNENGYLLFESQNILKEDKDWDVKLNAFLNAGLKEVRSGEIYDDGKIKRKFSLFQNV